MTKITFSLSHSGLQSCSVVGGEGEGEGEGVVWI